MSPQFSSFLTSPTIRLIPNPPVSQPCSDTQFIVHRGLLTSKSSYLKKRTRESYILLEGTSEETVGLFLEWLYTGKYDIPTDAIDVEEEEEEQHPVVTAAMAGCVGVWGYNKPAIIGRSYVLEKARSEGLRSKYVTFQPDGGVSVIGASEQIQLPSPPISPKIHNCKPTLNGINHDVKGVKPTTVPVNLDPPANLPQQKIHKPTITLDSILASHLAIYVFSMRYQISELGHYALAGISAFLELHTPCANSLAAFARGVYYDNEETGNISGLTRGTPLREFVARYSAWRLEEVKSSDGFKKLLSQGGEFVVDLVQCVMGGESNVGIWVK